MSTPANPDKANNYESFQFEFQTVLSKVAKLENDMESMKEKMTRLDTRVGNPEEGLVAQVRGIGNKLDDLTSQLADMRKHMYIAMGGGYVILFIAEKLLKF